GDASLYEGKYYLYFGPTPVVTLFLPWWAVTGNDIPPNFAAALFASGGFLATCLLFWTLLSAFELKLPLAMEAVVVVTIGFCQFVPFVLRRPMFYETAICAGYFFMTAGLLLAVRYLLGMSRRIWPLVVGGLCIGLSAGCRPHFAITAIVTLVVFAFGADTKRR